MDSLCDEILLQIFKYLTGHDLITITEAIPRYKRLINDKALWTWIDCRSKKSDRELVDFFNEKVHENTHAYMLVAQEQETICITKEILHKWATFNALTVLALENQQFDGNDFWLGDFPECLIELSLNKSQINNYYKFFQYCSKRLTSLKVLTLEYCQDLREHLLQPLSNLSSLEILSLYGCMDMRDSLVPINVAFEYGFKKLKVLDVRCTGLGNVLLRATAKMEQLCELYLHCYFHYTKERSNEEVEGTNVMNVEEKSTGPRKINEYLNRVNDVGLFNYRKSTFKVEVYDPPQSILYSRPFGKCKCDSKASPMNKFVETPSTTRNLNATPENLYEPGSSTSTTSTGTKRPHSDNDDTDSDIEGHTLRNGTSKRLKTSRKGGDSFSIEFQFKDGTKINSSKKQPIPKHHIIIDVHVAGGPHSWERLLLPPGDGDNRPQAHLNFLHQQRGVLRGHEGLCFRDIRVSYVNPDLFELKYSIGLNALMLRGSKAVSDEGLESLRQLRLDLIDLTGTNVTGQGLNEFRKYMPNCRIVHENFCTCLPR